MGAQALAVDRRFPSRHALVIAAFAGLLVFLLKDWLEADMARHMVIEFPLLLIAGAAIGRALDERFGAQIACCNQMGLVGFVFAAITLAYWMIPAALDAALLDEWVAVGKYISLVVSGALLWSSFTVAPLAVQVFFVGNFAWMTATVGLIYQSAPQQLCLNYQADTQAAAGEGLVGVAVIAAGMWCASVAPAFLDSGADA
jgi:hypothetical protein